MLRTALLALFCTFALSASQAQDAASPGAAVAALAENVAPAVDDAASPAIQARMQWRRTMAQKPAPKSGCFSTTFPSTEWVETPCSTAALRPHPARVTTGPHLAGGGNSPIAAPTEPISSASGSFAQVSGVTSESDPYGANHWSLQLNTNRFDTPACDGQPGCKGWEQFVTDNPGNVYIQYWLLNHSEPCPAKPPGFPDDWVYSPTDASGAVPGCVINGNQKAATQQRASDLQGLRLTGSTSNDGQSTILETANGQLVTAKDTGDPLLVGTSWVKAEFNIFGTDNGKKATFNQGSSILVRTEIANGSSTAPSCLDPPNHQFTSETNSLNPIPPCTGFAGQPGVSNPGVEFTEDWIDPIPGCSFKNTDAVCTQVPGSNFADATYSPDCPASGATMQIRNGSVWQPLPQHCSDGTLPGSCKPGSAVPNQYAISTQQYGLAWSGSPIGSSQTVEACVDASHCSRFILRVPSCPSVISPADSFALSQGNNPIEVMAGSSSQANLLLDGPWVSWDHGVGATGSAYGRGGLPPGTGVTLSPGASGAPHTYATMNVNVDAPPNAPPGDYQFQAIAKDVASHIALHTVVPVRVLACQPVNYCKVNANHCGPISDACGGSIDCGSCATGVCTNNICCPAGSFYNAAVNACQPNSCPVNTTYCPELISCATVADCNEAKKPVCEKIHGHLVCQ